MEIQSVILKLMPTRISIVYYRHMDLDQFIPHMCVTIDCNIIHGVATER